MAKKRKAKRIPFTVISQEIEKGLLGADQLRAIGLEGLHKVRRAKAIGLEREQGRLARRLGSKHPRVIKQVNKKELNQVLVRNLRLEIDRAKTEVPTIDENTWLLHGFVWDRDYKGVPNLTIGLYDENGNWIRQLGYGCTDKRGYFSIIYPQKGKTEKVISESMKLFLYVSDKNYKILYKDHEPLYFRIGQVDYREIYLFEEEGICTPPKPGKDDTIAPTDAWVVKGRVTDPQNRGIEGLTVSLYDKDLLFDDKLGTTVTDEDGHFMITYKTEDFRDLIEKKPDIYLKVMDKERKTLYTSKKTARYQAGSTESFNIKITSKRRKDDSRKKRNM